MTQPPRLTTRSIRLILNDLTYNCIQLHTIAYLGRRLLNTPGMFLLYYLSLCRVPRDINNAVFSNKIESSLTSLHDTRTALEHT
jgi:hypothetical protein